MRFHSMTCFSPLQGYESNVLTSKGKRKTTFNPRYARFPGKLSIRTVPCNRCSGCRLAYSREWAIRCMHEASLYGDCNSFITLTYNDHFLPRVYSDDGRILGNGTLDFDHWTKFMKRLRKALAPNTIRFYMGSEYGELNLRPHYHALIFNYDFPDKVFFKERNGVKLFRSSFLESLWTDRNGNSMGFCSVGSCTFKSAAYVARYMMKKVKGDDLDRRYERFNLETGEVFHVLSETARMSNKPGIAREWFNQFGMSDIYKPNKDFVTMDGRKFLPPKYYDTLLERISPEDFINIKSLRTQSMEANASEYTPERLAARELCHLASIKLLPRNLTKELLNVT